ncbi:hypothetical protein FHT78_005135 [Rhizobium sp. BK196]|jgi:hypothetical protein|nr:hypothetical protein [Rhizobium sp. BK196]MBB3464462.1 hypothetical protein [Rhizobium sp. BK377]
MTKALSDISRDPVSHLINTHWHFDHGWKSLDRVRRRQDHRAREYPQASFARPTSGGLGLQFSPAGAERCSPACLLQRASEAFRTTSRGAYTGVAAQPGKDGELLIAVSAKGGSKIADELSKGARFQLYLALRVAGYHEFVANRAPIPFIADDIMETFDDFRPEEAFRLFTEMARHGQVIYLTHHQHLTEIARKVWPGVRLHDLETLQSASRLNGLAAE